ncbi:sugar phosphate isomerase/epimerase [Fredinandcohnia onubensis]|nr:sugar phosphate isomerase/epimerase [Fredinandcohnia onubensis]
MGLGVGIIDFEGILSLLNEIGYSGYYQLDAEETIRIAKRLA